MNNQTNIDKYKKLAPVYDVFINNPAFKKARKAAFAKLECQPNDELLMVGVGTGEDLKYVDRNLKIVGIDISDDMLERAKSKANGKHVSLLNMNAERLLFQNQQFDVVILNLILSVVENPKLVMTEAQRVLKQGGKVLIFDKFLKEQDKPSFFRNRLNNITSRIGTDINRKFSDIFSESHLTVIEDESSIFAGNFRIILLQKD